MWLQLSPAHPLTSSVWKLQGPTKLITLVDYTLISEICLLQGELNTKRGVKRETWRRRAFLSHDQEFLQPNKSTEFLADRSHSLLAEAEQPSGRRGRCWYRRSPAWEEGQRGDSGRETCAWCQSTFPSMPSCMAPVCEGGKWGWSSDLYSLKVIVIRRGDRQTQSGQWSQLVLTLLTSASSSMSCLLAPLTNGSPQPTSRGSAESPPEAITPIGPDTPGFSDCQVEALSLVLQFPLWTFAFPAPPTVMSNLIPMTNPYPITLTGPCLLTQCCLIQSLALVMLPGESGIAVPI